MYKALVEIGGYKSGETVPDEKAEVWAQMYAVSPVEKIDKVEKEKKEEVVKEKPKEKSSDVMIDDYLDRNQFVITNNIAKDRLDKSVFEKMLKQEKSDKKRSRVIRALEQKIKELM